MLCSIDWKKEKAGDETLKRRRKFLSKRLEKEDGAEVYLLEMLHQDSPSGFSRRLGELIKSGTVEEGLYGVLGSGH